MNNQNYDNNSNERTSLFETNGEIRENVETPKPEVSVVTPIVERRDIADKTIDAVENFIDTKDHKEEYGFEVMNKNKKFAAISYMPMISLYFIITKKYEESDYLKFHVNQGLTITILNAAVVLVENIVSSIFSKGSLVLNSMPGIISIIFYAIYFLIIVAIFFGVVNTLNGLSKEIPIIGKIKLLK